MPSSGLGLKTFFIKSISRVKDSFTVLPYERLDGRFGALGKTAIPARNSAEWGGGLVERSDLAMLKRLYLAI